MLGHALEFHRNNHLARSIFSPLLSFCFSTHYCQHDLFYHILGSASIHVHGPLLQVDVNKWTEAAFKLTQKVPN